MKGEIAVLDQENKTTCRVCMSLRLFLMAVFAIALMTIINPDILNFVGNFSIGSIAITFIFVFGFFSLLKAIIDYLRISYDKQ